MKNLIQSEFKGNTVLSHGFHHKMTRFWILVNLVIEIKTANPNLP